MEGPISGDPFLDKALIRLVGAGFEVARDVSYDGADFNAVATRKQLAITRFGYSEEFFVFDELSALDWPRLEAFSEQAIRFAIKEKKAVLPRGLGSAVTCYPVALTEDVGPEVAAAVREQPAKKHWAAISMPVVYDRADATLHYLERTPVWGAAYYSGMRKTIAEALG